MTSIELRIQSIYDSLSNAEKKVADYFMANVENVFNKPIAQLTYADSMTDQDVAVLISMSGTTSEVLELLSLIKRCGTPTIALTKYSKTPLAMNADTVLYISAPEITMRSGAMSSRLAQLMVIDALFTAVAHTDYDAIAVNLEKTHESICSHRVSGITYRFE